ncbi:MAG: PASTA domain-containing protein [Desulfobacterales bacterium]|nr:PASTA domain-containing protein [Desulfobacterales bacterium]
MVIKKTLKYLTVLILFMAIFGISAYLTLNLIIKSEDTVVVPSITGKDIISALEIISNLELNTKVKGSEYSLHMPKNHILFQDPQPGTEIKKGRDVRILISKGSKVVLMPNIEGLTLTQARIILEENDLCEASISISHDPVVTADHIISTSPAPGSKISRETCVNLLVSNGQPPENYIMPDITGLSLVDAVLHIENNGLEPGKITSKYIENRQINLIVSQTPLPGYIVSTGAKIDLVINRKAGGNTDISLPGLNGPGLFRYKMDFGFLKKHINVRLNWQGISIELYNDFMEPGQEIWFLVPQNDDATIFLYEDEKLVETKMFNP